MPKRDALEKLEKRIIKEFPKDATKVSKFFKEENFFKILKFLESKKNSFNILPEIVLGAIEQKKIGDLKKCAESLVEKERHTEELFEACAQLWAKQIKTRY